MTKLPNRRYKAERLRAPSLEPPEPAPECAACGGTGYGGEAQQAWDEPGVGQQPCPVCDGTGNEPPLDPRDDPRIDEEIDRRIEERER